MRLLYFLLGALCVFSASGQSFININNTLGIQVFVLDNLYGSGVSFVDFDQNGLDDLTFCTHEGIKLYLNVEGDASPVDYGFVVDEDAKQPTWVDYDNDGDLDFFYTQYGHPLKLYQNDGNMNFVDVSASSGLPANNTNDSGACWGDYDRDGDLDLFVCTYIYLYGGDDVYDWNNHLYRNEGDGTFVDVSGFANVQDGISVSFQSVWIDYNNDRWPDLYVINDKEHPNRLYHNNMDGTFTEIAQENGSSIDMVDAMTATCGDFNNDGFEDIFVTNTSIGDCALLRNEGDGSFTDIAIDAGVDLDILGWAGNWFDADLDSDLDLYVCEYYSLQSSQLNAFMVNNGDETFENQNQGSFAFDFSNSYSSASGDWNNDGYPDLAVNNYSFQNANVWQNNGGDQNYLKFDLEGVVSNGKGIGSRIQVHHNSNYQSRQTYCGENYLGQNSFTQIIGLAQDSLVDSLIVEWPSGFVDRFIGLSANAQLHFVEGSSYAPKLSLIDTVLICPGDSVLVHALNGSNFQWNNGVTENSIWISEPGEYFVQGNHELGFAGESNHLTAIFEALVPGEITVQHVDCYGASSGQLIAAEADSLYFTWIDSPSSMSLSDCGAGHYEYQYQGPLGCVLIDSVEVLQPSPIVTEVQVQDITCYGASDGNVQIDITGGNGPYTIAWDGIIQDALAAADYSIAVLDSVGCEVHIDFQVNEPNELVLELISMDCENGLASFYASASGGTGDIAFEWSTGAEGESLEDVSSAGVYSVSAIDSNGCTVILENVECPTSVFGMKKSELNIFPNPAREEITVGNWSGDLEEVLLIDMTGKAWPPAAVIAEGVLQIKVKDLPAGVYVVMLVSEKSIYKETIVVE